MAGRAWWRAWRVVLCLPARVECVSIHGFAVYYPSPVVIGRPPSNSTHVRKFLVDCISTVSILGLRPAPTHTDVPTPPHTRPNPNPIETVMMLSWTNHFPVPCACLFVCLFVALANRRFGSARTSAERCTGQRVVVVATRHSARRCKLRLLPKVPFLTLPLSRRTRALWMHLARGWSTGVVLQRSECPRRGK
jgi:hypothetical protein